MDTLKFIKTEYSDQVATMRISRPEALNALSMAVLTELELALADAVRDESVRGIIVTGDGEKAFVAGADIRELGKLSKDEASNLARKGQRLFNSIENGPKPVIGVINGFALGGGCELAMSCHIRIATESARFGQPEVNLGIIPGYGGTQRLPQLVGRGRALELLLTGDLINAEEAYRIGLVNRVCKTSAEALGLARKMLAKVAGKGPVAIRHVIRAVTAGYSFADDGLAAEAEAFGECAATEDFKEGTSAFLEKRTPHFKGN